MLRIMKKYIFAFKVSPLGSLLMHCIDEVWLLFITAPILESLIIYIKNLLICFLDETWMRRSIPILFLHSKYEATANS